MTVHAVIESESDSREFEGMVVSLHLTRKGARAALNARKRELRKLRRGVVFYSAATEDNWDVDLSIQPYEVQP